MYGDRHDAESADLPDRQRHVLPRRDAERSRAGARRSPARPPSHSIDAGRSDDRHIDWNEQFDVTGYVGRSTGPIKVPLLIHNRRSLGGPAILDHCIIGVRETGKDGRLLYQLRRPITTLG